MKQLEELCCSCPINKCVLCCIKSSLFSPLIIGYGPKTRFHYEINLKEFNIFFDKQRCFSQNENDDEANAVSDEKKLRKNFKNKNLK